MKKTALATLITCMLMATIAHAATSYAMKCRKAACGMETRLTLGWTMMSGRVTGYYVTCKKFVTLSWKTRDMRTGENNIEPAPESLGKVLDSKTGNTLTVYACPHCKGPFSEIKKHTDVAHCPGCNDPGFKIVPNAPVECVEKTQMHLEGILF